MSFLQSTRRITLGASLLLAMLLLLTVQVNAATNASIQAPTYSNHTHVPYNAKVHYARQMLHDGHLAPTVHVLNSLPPTLILQFPLLPSGIKASFPNATALVTIVVGSHNDSTANTVTVDVQNMPPNITFTIFFIELATKPFGNVEYVADLTTRGDGSGESVFKGSLKEAREFAGIQSQIAKQQKAVEQAQAAALDTQRKAIQLEREKLKLIGWNPGGEEIRPKALNICANCGDVENN